MTKAKAMEQMLEYDRMLIDPMFARKIAKAFGYTLNDLGLKPKKTKDYYRSNYSEETAELSSVATYELAKQIAEKQGSERITSFMNGSGSYAEDITKKAVEYLKSNK